MKEIDIETFYGCKYLKRIEIPEGVEHIGDGCFSHSGVEEVTLPSTLRDINQSVFDDCDTLRVIWVKDDWKFESYWFAKESVEVRLQ